MSSSSSSKESSQSASDRSSWVEDVLYAETPLLRDQARAHLLRTASRKDVQNLINALSSPTRQVRRRSTRILAEMQPHRVHSYLLEYLQRPRCSTILHAQNTHMRMQATDEGVMCVARILTTLASQYEDALESIFKDPLAKVRRSSITPALPLNLLDQALLDSDLLVVEKACALWFKVSDFPQTQTIETALLNHPNSELVYRLYAQTSPQQSTLIHEAYKGNLIALQSITSLKDLIVLFDSYPQEVAWSLVHHQLFEVLEDQAFIQRLEHHSDALVRTALARLLPPHHPQLKSLLNDPDPNVAWTAQNAQNGSFNPEFLKTRLGPHQRLTLPSAQPPYGLRPHDILPEVHRVHAALALCHTRFDVNVGVAMRSAEAAGLEALYLMGESSLSTSPTRGAELAIPLHHAPDPLSLLMMARKAGYQIVAVQQTPNSQPYHQVEYPPCPLFVLGSEDSGLPDLLRQAADLVVEIPLYGLIDSLNVATAATCVIMHWRHHCT